MRTLLLLFLLLVVSVAGLPLSVAAAPAKKSATPAASSHRSTVKTTAVQSSGSASSSSIDTQVLKKITWQGHGGKGAILLELNGPVAYQYEYLPADATKNTPARLYIELPGVAPGAGMKPSFSPKGLPVTRIRIAQSGAVAQVILDCGRLGAYAVSTQKSAPDTIRIDVSGNADLKGGVNVIAQAPEKKKDPRSAPGTLMEQLGLTVETIMLDAGHGGKDPGTMGHGITEGQFTLKMAKIVGALLQKKGFTVLYTRSTDKYISLEERTVAANSKKVDLFVSLHANANPDAGVQGLETYYLDMAKTSGAAKVAARENAVSTKNISDLQFILTDLMLNAKTEESHDLAKCVHKGILTQLGDAKIHYHDNGVRSAPFYVLTGARMPSILVEFGYVSNKDDAANLSIDKFLQQQAEGLVDGIVTYKAKLARFAPKKNDAIVKK